MAAIAMDGSGIQHRQKGLMTPSYRLSSPFTNRKITFSELDFLLRHMSTNSTKSRNRKPGKQQNILADYLREY